MHLLTVVAFLAAGEAVGSIEGYLVNRATRTGVAGAPVKLLCMQNERPPCLDAETRTATDGKFVFEGVTPGSYGVLDASPSFYSRGKLLTANVIAGERVRDLVLQVDAYCSLSGRILDTEKRPVKGATVTAGSEVVIGGEPTLATGKPVTTDENGQYTIPHLRAGKYFVRASRGDAPGIWYPSAASITAATPLHLAAGVVEEGVDIVLRPLRSFGVKGKLAGVPSDIPPSEVRVSLRAQNRLESDRDRDAVYVEGGSFSVDRVLPGEYLLSARREYRYRIAGGAEFTRRRLLARSEVSVGEADVSRLVAPVPPRCSFTGRVLLDDEPAPALVGRRVELHSRTAGQNLLEGAIGADGAFTISECEPVRYHAIVPMPEGVYLDSLTVNGQDALTRGIDRTSGGEGTLRIDLRSGAGRLSGQAEGVETGSAVIVPAEHGPDSSVRPRIAPVKGGRFSASLRPGAWHAIVLDGAQLDSVDQALASELIGRATRVEIQRNGAVDVQAPVIAASEFQERQ